MRVRHLTHTTGYRKKPKNKNLTQLEPVCEIALPAIEDSQNDQTLRRWKILKVQHLVIVSLA